MSIPFKSDEETIKDAENFSGSLFNLLDPNHDCFTFQQIFQELDTSTIEAQFSPIGQHAYHPKKIVSILIYGYSHGIFSSRKLEQACTENLAFMYIAGANCPNFRVLSDFRKDNPEFFQECFKQTVQLAIAKNMASLGNVSLDGTKIKANTSKHKAMSYGHMKKLEAQLCAEIEVLVAQANSSDTEEDADVSDHKAIEDALEELKFKQARLEKILEAKKALEEREEELNPGQEIPDKKQMSFADKDARIMGKNGVFNYDYNGQACVDKDDQIIVEQHITQNANDQQEVREALEKIEENTGTLPDAMTLDNGYYTGPNLEALDEKDVKAFVAPGRGEGNNLKPLNESERDLKKSDFTYDEENDCFTCPNGKTLPLQNKNQNTGACVYQGDAKACSECPLFARCCKSKKGEARTINTDKYEPFRREMCKLMRLAYSKEMYKARKTIVEPVFGQIKNGGFKCFSVRGKEKVAGEFALVCAAHNIKKMVKKAIAGLLSSASAEMAA